MKAILMALAIVVVAAGCGVQKSAMRQRIAHDSVVISSLSADKKRLESENESYKKKVSEYEYGVIDFDTKCDTILIETIKQSGCNPSTLDSALRLLSDRASTIKKLSDGSVEAKGNITRYAFANTKLSEENKELKKMVSQLESLRKTDTVYVSKASDVETKQKSKRGFTAYAGLGILTLMLLSAILGYWYGRKQDK